MKAQLIKLRDLTKQDFKVQHDDFKLIVIKFAILGIFLLINCFLPFFVWITLGAALIFALTEFNGRAIYYVIFFVPLMAIFKREINSVYLLTYLAAAVILMLGIKLLVELFIKKTKKINWLFTLLFFLMIIYFMFPFKFENISILLSLILGACLLFVAYYYKEDLDAKELIFVFILGLLTSIIIGLFRPCSVRLQNFIGIFTAYGELRFSGCYSNPNPFAGEVMLGLSLIYFLVLNKKIQIIQYPLIVVFTVSLLCSLSKAGLIIFFVVTILFLLAYLIKYHNKSSIISILSILLLIGVSMLICFNKCEIVFTRIFSAFGSGSGNGTSSGNNTSVDLGELTTGRSEIWKTYLSWIFKTPYSILFGYGVGASAIGEYAGISNFMPHNTYLQCLYYVGFVGVLLMIATLFFARETGKKIKVNVFAFIPIISVAMYLMACEFFSFRLGVYLIILLKVLFYGETKTEKVVETKAEGKDVVENKIPKIIHYIWLGGNPLPKVAEECIESWKKYCPDYEIKRWDESNLNIDCCEYCRQAYDAKKYAFASDVARFDVLYKEGGIYLDIDVKLLKPLDEFLVNECFMGFEHKEALAPGLIMGCAKGNSVVAELFDSYKNDKFVLENGELNLKTICVRTTDYLVDKGLQLDNTRQNVGGVEVYPTEYFCPLSPITNKKEITDNTYAIHLYYSSWYSKKAKLKKFVKKTLNFITNGYFGIWLYEYKKRKSA